MGCWPALMARRARPGGLITNRRTAALCRLSQADHATQPAEHKASGRKLPGNKGLVIGDGNSQIQPSLEAVTLAPESPSPPSPQFLSTNPEKVRKKNE